MKLHLFIFTCVLAFCSLHVHAQGDKIIGTWLSEEEDGHVEIYKHGGKYHGKISWIKDPLDEVTRKPKTDKQNPDASRRNRPLMGLVILKDFAYDHRDKEWEDGTIYDPNSGNTYDCYMELISGNKLKIRGYIGVSLIGRTSYWTRVGE